FSDVETDVLFEGNVTRRNLRADSAYGWGIQLQPLFARGLVLNVTLRHNRSYANRMGLFVPILSSDDVRATVVSIGNSYDHDFVGMVLHAGRSSGGPFFPRGANRNTL